MTQTLHLGRERAGFAILAVLVGATALVAGCYAPSPPMVAARAAAQYNPVVAQVEAVAHRCEATMLDEEHDFYPRSSGEEWFTLGQPCHLDAALTVRVLVGDLAVRLEGPGGFRVEHRASSVMPGGRQPLGQQEGLVAPEGTYHDTYEATGKAHFLSRVVAGKP